MIKGVVHGSFMSSIKLAIMLESPNLICQSWPKFEEMKHWHITWLQNLDDNFGGCSSTH